LLVVAGEEHGAEPEALQLGDRFRARFLDRVGDDEDRARCTVPGGSDRGLAVRLRRGDGGCEAGVELDAPVREERRPPDDERVAIDDALDAEALTVRERLDGR
jgi:hypothetical protein